MGNCIYCGEPAGFLRKSHRDCKEANEKGKKEIIQEIIGAWKEGYDLNILSQKVAKISKECRINDNIASDSIVNGWEMVVDIILNDTVITEQNEKRLFEIRDYFNLSKSDIDRNGAYTRVIKSAVVRDVMDGRLPERVKIDGSNPFNFQKSEKMIWIFDGVQYFEEKKTTQYVGRSNGISIKIAKGLYYRTGAFAGQKIQSSQTVHADTGAMAITNKSIYFAGKVKRFRIPYSKIVSFIPYSDGIGLHRDAASATPQTFKTGDGWFTYNVVTNLSQI